MGFNMQGAVLSNSPGKRADPSKVTMSGGAAFVAAEMHLVLAVARDMVAITRIYLASARRLRRWKAICRTPIYPGRRRAALMVIPPPSFRTVSAPAN